MEYLSQIDHLVEVLRFLLSKVPDDQFSDDVKLLKLLQCLANLHSGENKHQNKEDGELVTFPKEHEIDNNIELGKTDNPKVDKGVGFGFDEPFVTDGDATIVVDHHTRVND